jgi:Xaa-Pro dipeptidase
MTIGIGGSTWDRELGALQPLPGRPAPIAPTEFDARMEKARALMREAGMQALLVGAGASLRYFTGVGWGATERLVAVILPVEGEPVMICPAFEFGSLQAGLKITAEIRLWQEDESPAALVAWGLRERNVSTLGFDPALPFLAFDRIRAAAPEIAIRDASAIIDGCRSIKSAAELALLQYAKSSTLEVQRRAARILRTGITTVEVRSFIDAAHRKCGADNGSYFCTVQFGTASAYPHGIPGEQSLAQDELVLIDTGCQMAGYHSDVTRTYVFGEPRDEHRRIWAIEHEAQAAAFAAVRPGVACGHIDQVARDVLERHGLGPDYDLPGLPHRTGHGIGLSIHEAPYLVRGDNTPLAPGMCFSNEPMIVIPDQFGVRLEDHFYVTEEGAAWFTEPSPSIERPFA